MTPLQAWLIAEISNGRALNGSISVYEKSTGLEYSVESFVNNFKGGFMSTVIQKGCDSHEVTERIAL